MTARADSASGGARTYSSLLGMCGPDGLDSCEGIGRQGHDAVGDGRWMCEQSTETALIRCVPPLAAQATSNTTGQRKIHYKKATQMILFFFAPPSQDFERRLRRSYRLFDCIRSDRGAPIWRTRRRAPGLWKRNNHCCKQTASPIGYRAPVGGVGPEVSEGA